MAVQLLLSEKIPEIFSGNETIVTHKGVFCGTFQSNTGTCDFCCKPEELDKFSSYTLL